MKKDLKTLFKNINHNKWTGSSDLEVSSICYDSRECKPGSLFVAIRGLEADGHDYIDQAVENGASVIVVDRNIRLPAKATVIKVNNSRVVLALLSANFFDNPAEKMKVIGVTGTNGKTTTIHMLNSIYQEAGYKTGMIGTIGANINGKEFTLDNTTPESYDLQKILYQMAQEGLDYCFMEVSSHALSLNRVAGINFHASIYTNLSPDHMEFHNDMEEYYLAKRKLFRLTSQINVINFDDYWGNKIINEESRLRGKLVTFSIENPSSFRAINRDYSLEGSQFDLANEEVTGRLKTNLPGQVNIYNSLAAVSLALTDGLPFEKVEAGLAKMQGVAGRFELVYKDDQIRVVIDFAHTEDALKETILSLKPYFPGRIILVFGVYAAAGQAGRPKRLAMGRTAAKYADYMIVSSDNPKKQNPQEIIDEIIEGIKSYDPKASYTSYVDRKEAIEYAIKMSGPGDLILLTGKGHERAQVIGNERIPFNEREIVLELVSKYKNKAGI